MRRSVFALLLVSVMSSVNAQSVNVDTIPKDKFWYFLLIGQSNMVGQGSDMSYSVSTAPAGVYKLSYPVDTSLAATQASYWMKSKDPVHEQPGYLTAYNWVKVGPAMGFAQRLRQRLPDVRVGLIPCAVNGADLARLQKGGDLYKFEVKRAGRAAQNGVLKGILMHQGEDDARIDFDRASTYSARLTQMIKDLRAELHADSVPFLIGNLGEWDYAKADSVYPGNAYANVTKINMIKQGFVDAVNNNRWTYVISTAGLTHEPDFVHFNASSEKALGERYADTLFKHYQRMTHAVAGRGVRPHGVVIENRGGVVRFGSPALPVSEVALYTAQGRCVRRLVASSPAEGMVGWDRSEHPTGFVIAHVLHQGRWSSFRCGF